MSKLDDGVHYFTATSGYSDVDEGLGYVSIKSNRLHAIGKPARVNQEGSVWMVNGKEHRVDGPAVENKNGSEEWWLNGKRHRIGDPAITFVSGDVQYYENGKCSRKDGAAVENADGYKEYWVDGNKINEEDFRKKYLSSSKPKIK